MPANAVQTVAIFDASDETVEMLQGLLSSRGYRTVTGHVDHVKSGALDFAAFVTTHTPDAMIWDIAPPYDRNWNFFKLIRTSHLLDACALVLTTTHKQHLDALVGADTGAIEIVGKPYDLHTIVDAVSGSLERERSAGPGRVRLDRESRTDLSPRQALHTPVGTRRPC
jgi:DNA-binding response OmpR family regulator